MERGDFDRHRRLPRWGPDRDHAQRWFLYDSTGDTGRARYTYQVCEAGTSTCSNEVTVTFPSSECIDDSWTATSTSRVPFGRGYHTAVWTGTEMIVWGGIDFSYVNTGGRYNPSTDSWTATSTTGAPARPKRSHRGVDGQ